MATTPGSEASIIFGKGYHFRPAWLDRPPRLGGVRHRSGPRELLSHGVEVKRGLPRSRSSRPFLRLVCRVQRPGRQRLAAPGDYDAAARPDQPRGDDVRIRRAIWRARFGVRWPPTTSTRSASARQTRTGPIGTPSTWSPSRPARSHRNEHRMRRIAFLLSQSYDSPRHCAVRWMLEQCERGTFTCWLA